MLQEQTTRPEQFTAAAGKEGPLTSGRRRSVHPGVLMALAALLLIAFGLRVMRLEVQSIWVDEGFSIDFASRSAADMTAMWKSRGGFGAITDPAEQKLANDPLAIAVDIHPPLYYFILHEWLPLAGRGEYAVRFPSVIAGTLLVLALFKLGSSLGGPGLGLTAAGVGAVSPFYIAYSQEARMYGPVALFSALSLYFAWQVVRGSPSRERSLGKGWRSRAALAPMAGLVVFSSLALYTHYSAVLVILAENAMALAVILWRWRRGRQPGGLFVRWTCTQAIALLAFLPWLATSLGQVASYDKNFWVPNWRYEITDTFSAFDAGMWIPTGSAQRLSIVITGLLAVLLAVAVYRAIRRPSQAAGSGPVALLFAAGILLLELGAALIIFQIRPEFHPRYLMVLETPYYLLLGVGLYALWRQYRPGAVVAGALVLGISLYGLAGYQFDPNFAKDDTRTLAQYLSAHTTADDVIFLDAPEPLGYYYHGPAKLFYVPGDEATVAPTMTRLAKGKKNVVLVQWFLSTSDPEQLVPFLLQKYGRAIDDHGFRGYHLREFALPSSDTQFTLSLPSTRAPVTFANRFQLLGASYGPAAGGSAALLGELQAPEAMSGGNLMLALRWKLLTAVSEDYKVTAYLTDANGHRGGQVDLSLQQGQASTSRWKAGDEATNYYVMPLAPGLMPGEYQLHLAVYASGSDERLSVLDAAGAPQGGDLLLGQVHILPPSGGVDTSTLGIPQHLQQAVAPGIELIGFDLPKTTLLQGEKLDLTLFWSASASPALDHAVSLRLAPANPASGAAAQPGATESRGGWNWSGKPGFATSQWHAGDAFRDWLDATLPATLPAGTYELLAGMDGHLFPLEQVRVQELQRSFSSPTPEHPLRATLDQSIELLGYNLDRASYAPGQLVRLTLFWKAMAPVSASYTVFAHVLDSSRKVVAQQDSIPLQGTAPTTSWAPGQIVQDVYELRLPPVLAAGDYQLETGMYRADTGVRLRASASGLKVADNGIVIGSLVVGPAPGK